jgi:hypothetical protein
MKQEPIPTIGPHEDISSWTTGRLKEVLRVMISKAAEQDRRLAVLEAATETLIKKYHQLEHTLAELMEYDDAPLERPPVN